MAASGESCGRQWGEAEAIDNLDASGVSVFPETSPDASGLHEMLLSCD